MQALLCDSHIALLKAEGKVFMKQLQQRAALADLLTAAGSGDATAKSKLSMLTTVYLMSPRTRHLSACTRLHTVQLSTAHRARRHSSRHVKWPNGMCKQFKFLVHCQV